MKNLTAIITGALIVLFLGFILFSIFSNYNNKENSKTIEEQNIGKKKNYF